MDVFSFHVSLAHYTFLVYFQLTNISSCAKAYVKYRSLSGKEKRGKLYAQNMTTVKFFKVQLVPSPIWQYTCVPTFLCGVETSIFIKSNHSITVSSWNLVSHSE